MFQLKKHTVKLFIYLYQNMFTITKVLYVEIYWVGLSYTLEQTVFPNLGNLIETFNFW